MSIRVGIDLVRTATVRDSIDAHGERYLERVYSRREVRDCSSSAGLDAERLAARFAAKEAAFKVLRVGDDAVSWREVEVCREPSGWVRLSLTGNAATLAQRAGIRDLSLSLTHDHGCAAAVVVAQIDELDDTEA
jgi:holo-[acyl-carrier protein] synthase